MFHAVDWLPTLAEIADVELRADPKLHGKSQLQALRGGEAARKYLFLGFGERTYKRGADKYPPKNKLPKFAAIRSKNWKLIYNFETKKKMLYNIRNDPAESKNVAWKKQKIVDHLWSRMRSHLREGEMPVQKDMTCGDITLPLTPWGQKAWQPWCS